MTRLYWLIGVILLLLPLSPSSPSVPVEKKKADLVCGSMNNQTSCKCGETSIKSELVYCTKIKGCDRAGFINRADKLPLKDSSFALCDANINARLQVRIHDEPAIWKNITSINCIDEVNKTIDILFAENGVGNHNPFKEIALRCVSEGRARFDIYHYSRETNENDGVYVNQRFFFVYILISLLIAIACMAAYYWLYLILQNRKLFAVVTYRESKHDELWLNIERAERKGYDPEEVWNAMPLVHQQVVLEAAHFIQKYRGEKFTPQLRQWIVDRGYPAGATEIILVLAGLQDPPDFPFFGPEERQEGFKVPNYLVDSYAERVESRIIDTLNYANRLRRRKIVFTDHRWLELHHLLLELTLSSLGSPSHPTIHDADIPALPRHAFGTRDDPREEEREEKEMNARSRRPHFLHHNWDEAQRLLGTEA